MTWVQFGWVRKWLNYFPYSLSLILGKTKRPSQHCSRMLWPSYQLMTQSFVQLFEQRTEAMRKIKELLTTCCAVVRVSHWEVGDVCFVGWRPIAFLDTLMIGYSWVWFWWQMLCQRLQIKVKAINPEFLYDGVTVSPSYECIGIKISYLLFIFFKRHGKI
jgi:hypothetical protein